METKICSKCGLIRIFPVDFPKDRSKKSGYASRCKECDHQYNRTDAIRKWHINHPNYRKTYPRDKEYERIYQRHYLQKRRDNDPEYRKWKAQKDKEYRQTTLGKLRLSRARVKRRSYKGIPKLTSEQWEVTFKAFNTSCAYCGNSSQLTYDHFIPLKFGGGHIFGNVIPACLHCNSSKGSKMPDKWCSEDQLSCVMSILKRLYRCDIPCYNPCIGQ